MYARKLVVPAGETINTACDKAVEMAKEENCNVEFEFNQQTISASPGSDPAQLARAYTKTHIEKCERRASEHAVSSGNHFEDKKHWGDTLFGQALGVALVLIGLFGGIALVAWATHSP